MNTTLWDAEAAVVAALAEAKAASDVVTLGFPGVNAIEARNTRCIWLDDRHESDWKRERATTRTTSGTSMVKETYSLEVSAYHTGGYKTSDAMRPVVRELVDMAAAGLAAALAVQHVDDVVVSAPTILTGPLTTGHEVYITIRATVTATLAG